MLRGSTSGSNYFNEHLTDIMDSVDQDTSKYNASFQSASSNASASSSKAVLAALRALQDKIRRLEQERSQALDESTQLRQQLQTQELEFENAKKRESLSASRSVQESRHELDRLISEKTELEIRVAKLDERNRDSREATEELKNKIMVLEEEKYHAAMKLKEFETDHQQLEHQIELQQRKESELAQAMAREAHRFEEDIDALNTRFSALQKDLSVSIREKSEADARLVELDELVSQLLGLNEALVAKLSGKPVKRSLLLSGKPSSASAVGSGMKKKVSSKKFANVPRAASATTVATEAGKVQKYEITRHLNTVHVDSADVDHLQMLHNMYRGMAKTLTGKKGSKSSAGAGASASGESKTRSASQGRQPTRMSRKKQQRSQEGSASESFAHSRSVFNSQDDSEFDYQSDSRLEGSRSRMARTHSASPSLGRRTNNSSRHDASFTSQSDLHAVIGSLEDEFDSLNENYRKLLASSSRDGGDGTEPAHADELISVIQQLHKKGEQLRTLKAASRT